MNTTDMALLCNKSSRRQLIKNLGLGALGVAAFGTNISEGQIAINSTETTSPFPILSISENDLDILDFALNLEYLEANFYSYATSGLGIEQQGIDITGRGVQGTVTVPTNTVVPFTGPDDPVGQYAFEIAADELRHVKFLRGIVLAAGKTPIAQPAIDLVNSFNAAAAAAGLGSLNPFSSDTTFLLGAFLFEDTGVTAYHGALASIVNRKTQSAAAGIMGTEAYHASLIRSLLYDMGSATQADTTAIAAAINTLGGAGIAQGVVVNGMADIAPTDSNALVFTRTTQQVLNIVYLSANGTAGGFFPSGINP